MRGEKNERPQMFCWFHAEERIRPDHPLRAIKRYADQVLGTMNRTFNAMYGEVGRPSVPPEVLLKSQLLMALYTVRSDRLFCERLDTDILFRWFLDMDMDEASFDHSTFSKNRERLIEHEVAQKFFEKVVEHARGLSLLSDEHFTVDGTLIESLASLKSFQRKDGGGAAPPAGDDPGNPTVDFHGEKRTNETHRSTTDPEARLYRKGKGQPAQLCYIGNAVMENRNGLCVGFRLDRANGKAERRGAMRLVKRLLRQGRRLTSLGGDKNYHTTDFVGFLRGQGIRPHVALHGGWHIPGIDRRTTRHTSYQISQRRRKWIEQKFGWLKTIGGLFKSRFIGRERPERAGLFALAAYNLLRIGNLVRQAP
jgi:transposase